MKDRGVIRFRLSRNRREREGTGDQLDNLSPVFGVFQAANQSQKKKKKKNTHTHRQRYSTTQKKGTCTVMVTLKILNEYRILGWTTQSDINNTYRMSRLNLQDLLRGRGAGLYTQRRVFEVILALFFPTKIVHLGGVAPIVSLRTGRPPTAPLGYYRDRTAPPRTILSSASFLF